MAGQNPLAELLEPGMFERIVIAKIKGGWDLWLPRDHECKFAVGQMVYYVIEDEHYKKLGKVKVILKQIGGERCRMVSWLINTDIVGLPNWVHESHFVSAQ